MMNDKWKSAFDNIHAEDELKEHTKKYLSRKVYSRRRGYPPVYRKIAAAAITLFLIFFGGGSWLYMTPTAYISIDINPSLELGINRFDRIVSVKSYNEDGENLAESFHIRFKNYNDALEEILASSDIEGYLSQDAAMSLTVAGDNETQYSEIYDTVENCASSHENISCHSGDTGEMHEAHEAGVSFGKYRAYLKLKEIDPSVTLDDVRDLTMREIYNRIDAYSGNQKKAENDSETTSSEDSGTNSSDSYRHNEEHHGGGHHHDIYGTDE